MIGLGVWLGALDRKIDKVGKKMSRVCELTGKRVKAVNNISHAHNVTKSRRLPNLQKKTYFVLELKQKISVRICCAAIKTVDKKGGLLAALRSADESLLSPRLLKFRRKYC